MSGTIINSEPLDSKLLENNKETITETPVDINGWGKDQEQYLYNILRKCSIYSWIHTQSVLYYQKFDYLLTIIPGALALILGTVYISYFSRQVQCNDNFTFGIVYGLLDIIIGLSLLIKNYQNYPDKIEKHKNMSIDTLLLKSKIEKQFGLPCDKRDNCATFIMYNVDTFDEIIRKKMNIPKQIDKLFYKRFKYHIIDIDTHILVKLYHNTNDDIKISIITDNLENDAKDIAADKTPPTKSPYADSGMRLQQEYEERLKKIKSQK